MKKFIYPLVITVVIAVILAIGFELKGDTSPAKHNEQKSAQEEPTSFKGLGK
jgi:hypothetical protein